MASIKILIVDDERNIRMILQNVLSDEGYSVETAQNGIEALEKTSSFQPHIILMDKNMPKMGGIEALIRIKEENPNTAIVIVTAHGDISSAVEAMKYGAYDYIEKPFDNDLILLLLKRATKHLQLQSEVENLRNVVNEKFSFQNIIGHSSSLKKVLNDVSSVCETNATVLITGESGTGKELIAKSIHMNSLRKKKPLITVNCGAIPSQLIESELFGHEKGAFTDAKETRMGKFELADGGTLFLDEVGELSLEAQVKLLRVLEDKKITRIGGQREIPVDIRLISATNKNLHEKVQNNQFRLDLYYRLNVFTITMPSLNERKEDIPYLTEHFIQKHNPILQTNVTGCTKEVLSALLIYPWPGNIRDLENAIQSAMIMAKKGKIQLSHLPSRLNIENLKKIEYSRVKSTYDEEYLTEKDIIIAALEKCKYNRTETARSLGISRKTLFNKMQKYGLDD